jgi:hypothetical protein
MSLVSQGLPQHAPRRCRPCPHGASRPASGGSAPGTGASDAAAAAQTPADSARLAAATPQTRSRPGPRARLAAGLTLWHLCQPPAVASPRERPRPAPSAAGRAAQGGTPEERQATAVVWSPSLAGASPGSGRSGPDRRDGASRQAAPRPRSTPDRKAARRRLLLHAAASGPASPGPATGRRPALSGHLAGVGAPSARSSRPRPDRASRFVGRTRQPSANAALGPSHGAGIDTTRRLDWRAAPPCGNMHPRPSPPGNAPLRRRGWSQCAEPRLPASAPCPARPGRRLQIALKALSSRHDATVLRSDATPSTRTRSSSAGGGLADRCRPSVGAATAGAAGRPLLSDAGAQRRRPTAASGAAVTPPHTWRQHPHRLRPAPACRGTPRAPVVGKPPVPPARTPVASRQARQPARRRRPGGRTS